MIDSVIFERLGLPKHSGAIYKLLQRKALLVAEISRELGIHRPAVYRAIDALETSSFITSEKGGARTLYRAAAEKRITESFAKLTSKASSTASSSGEDDSVTLSNLRILTGKRGIRAAFDDVIVHTPKGETFYRYTSEQDLARVNSYLSDDYRAKRDAKKLERLVISNPLSGKQKRSRLERFIAFVPPELEPFQQDVIQLIYGNRISLIDLNTEQVVIIENPALANFQRSIFKMLYRKLVK